MNIYILRHGMYKTTVGGLTIYVVELESGLKSWKTYVPRPDKAWLPSDDVPEHIRRHIEKQVEICCTEAP